MTPHGRFASASRRASTEADPLTFMAGGGAAGEVMRAVDWRATPLGPPEEWPIALKTLVAVVLSSNQAMFVAWGPERTMLYNGRYAAICGARHPAAMGAPFREVWFDIMDQVGPILERAFAGEPTQMDNIALTLHRNGYPEEAHFAFSYTPVRGESGTVDGMFCACTETTGVVLAGQRAAAERERQRLMLQHMPGFCALLVGPEHRYEYVNEAYVAIAGRREFVGRTVREVFPELIGQGFYELLDRVYASGDRFGARAAPVRLDRPDGDRFIDFLYEPVRDDAGRVAGIFVGGYDVTEQYRAEAARTQGEERLRLAQSVAGIGIHDYDIAGNRIFWDARVRDVWGLPDDLPITYDVFAAGVHPEDLPAVEAAVARALDPAGDGNYVAEYRVTNRRDAVARRVAATGTVIFSEGRPVRLVGTVRDVTRERTAERQRDLLLRLVDRLRSAPESALATAADMLGRHLGSSRVGYGEADEAGDVIEVDYQYTDQAAAPVSGRRRLADFGPEIVADLQTGRTLVVTDVLYDPRTRHAAVAHAATGTRAIITVPLVREGRLRATLYLEHREARVWTAQEVELVEEVAARTWAAVEQARAEDALRRSEARYRELFEAIDDGFCIQELTFDEDGRCVDYRLAEVNPAFERQTGLTGAAGRWVSEVAPGLERSWFDTYGHVALTGEAVRFENYAEPLGRWYSVYAFRAGDPVERRVGVLFSDITARRQAEQDLRRLNETLEARVREEVAAREAAQARLAHAQRMEALGQLAGGIAHDFNNVLQAVQGGVRLIEAQPEDTDRVRRLTGMMAEAAARGSAITRRLLSFSRRADLRAEPLDAAELLGGLAEVLSHTMGDGIRAEVSVPPGLPPLVADKGQLETVLVNLASNARDAMSGQGLIRLTAAVEAIAAGGPRPLVRLPAGEYVRLSVSDAGSGMAPEVLARAVEPFFTTKPNGRGTGLGLAMARGFAEQSGGALHITSAAGAGTTVSLWLPAASARPVAAAPGGASVVAGRAERHAKVLLVDDDAMVREIVAEGLRAAGFDVTALGAADEALKLLDQGAPVDALVSDLSMPKIDGLTLLEETHRRRPGLPAILLTGFATDAADLTMQGAVSGAFSLLRKPIEATVLAERIAALLSGAEVASATGPLGHANPVAGSSQPDFP